MRSRLARIAVSWLLVGIGAPLLIRADVGVSPFDVLTTGLSEVAGWSIGTGFVLSSLLFFGTGRLLGAPVGPASIPGTLAIGVLVDRGLAIVPDPTGMAARVPMYVAGLLVIAAAICLGVSTDLGAGPSEVLMLGLMRHRVPVVPARWISDGTPVLVGAVLGGAIGVGTLIFVVTMGPMVRLGLTWLGYLPRRD